MAKSSNKNDRNNEKKPAAASRPEPAVEIWCGGLQWALKEGYRPTDTLAGVRQELGLWLENLDELIQAFGPKANVGEVLLKAGDDEADASPSSRADDDDDD